MAQKYKICLLNKNSTNRFPLNYVSLSAKTYFEENSSYVHEWQWGDFSYEYANYSQLFDEILKENPTVVGFSNYVWNELFNLKFAEELRQHLPDVIIVFGGPQNRAKYDLDVFKKYPFIDLIIPGDAYGEVTITDVLNNISENNGIFIGSQINYAYWPSIARNRNFNPLTVKKKDFVWPTNSYKAQQHLITPVIDQITDKESLWLTLETSRGCPYKCSFCDWGGGTYTKTVKKPTHIVLDEITWASENQINGVYFMDANFGIFDIDIEFIKHLVEQYKKNGYPKRVFIQPTKAKIQNLRSIYELLAIENLLPQYLISIQDLDDDVKKNVDRVDFPFEVQIQMFKELQKKQYLPIAVDYILGLPGSSVSTIKSAIHRFSIENIATPIGYPWSLLPETPAYDPVYREKFKLITVDKKHSSGASTPIKQKQDRHRDQGVSITIDDGLDMASEYVIGTYSYTPADWVQMNMLLLITSATQSTRVLDKVADYLWKEHQVNYGDFFETVMNTLLRNDTIGSTVKENFQAQSKTLTDWLDNRRTDIYCDYHADFHFTLSPPVYLLFVTLLDTDKFFEAVLVAISQLTVVDDKIIDLCYYSRSVLIDITYRPGRTFETKYNWPEYFSSKTLRLESKQYKILDTQLLSGGKWFDIDWEQYQGTINYYTHFVYRACYDYKSSVAANNIIEL